MASKTPYSALKLWKNLMYFVVFAWICGEFLENGWTSPFTADLSATYSWGNYSDSSPSPDAHAGLAVPLFAGYRLRSGFAFGAAGIFALPKISVAGASNNVDFSFSAVGAQAGWLWQNRLEPFVLFFPFAKLKQSQVNLELEHQGLAFGGGAKLYFTEPSETAAQVGLKFSYLRERYAKTLLELSAISSRNNGQQASVQRHESSNPVLGDTYQLGLFIGI